MKKFNEFRKKHTFIVSILLVLMIAGVATTVALVTAKTAPVINTFKAADMDTEIVEPTPDPTPQPAEEKRVTVQNNGGSSAFIRVRVTVSPENAAEPRWETKTDWYYDSDDGFYYYLAPLAGGGKTAPLFDGVNVSDEFKNSHEDFDVTVYQESCVAVELDDTLTPQQKLEKIKEIFEAASGKPVGQE